MNLKSGLLNPLLTKTLVLLLMFASNLYAEQTLVAVASNFTAPAKQIAAAFEAETQHKAVLSFGSTGKLYAQIINGAPYQVFMAADAERPNKLEAEGLTVAESNFTYAQGKIALFSSNPTMPVDKGIALFLPETFNKLAIANPKTAPYGKAAVEVMTQLNVFSQRENKLVQGENIAQTYQFVITGNAAIGFIASSQLKQTNKGTSWVVPQALYTPIHQNAVLLIKGKNNEAAEAFMAFLKSPHAQRIITSFGYGKGISPTIEPAAN